MTNFHCDFHSHTIYGDGKNTPAEMAEAAFRLGLTDYGISEHGFLDNYAYSESKTFGMDEAAFIRYLKELEELKERYKGKMHLYIGVEQDGMGPEQKADYTIGSTHQLLKNGEYVMIDESEEILVDAVNRLWGGDWYALTADYYRQEAKIAALTNCQIIGHFDLLRKYAASLSLFHEADSAYRRLALSALERAFPCGGVLEINTGGMARGYLTTPYPTLELLCAWRELGGRITLTSDCHDRRYLAHAFPQAAALARQAGFRTALRLGTGTELWEEAEL